MRASADLEQVRPDCTSMESHRTIERDQAIACHLAFASHGYLARCISLLHRRRRSNARQIIRSGQVDVDTRAPDSANSGQYTTCYDRTVRALMVGIISTSTTEHVSTLPRQRQPNVLSGLTVMLSHFRESSL